MLSVFPFLSPEEFECACRAFRARVDALGNLECLGWSSIRLDHHQNCGLILKISRNIPLVDAHHEESTTHQELADHQEEQLEIFEEDPEALLRTTDLNTWLQVQYEIILSPTYQVPVLYFTLSRVNHQGPVGLDAVYQHLVPDQYKKELKNVGVMGGISFDYHPGSGSPSFFVHPCNTADAMRPIADGQNTTPETYFLIWLGLVGNCVSLHIPSELFAMDMQNSLKAA